MSNSRWIEEEIDQGEVGSRDVFELREGELIRASGWYYREGDKGTLHKISGRQIAGDTGTGEPIKDIHIGMYDSGDGQIIALSNGNLHRKQVLTDAVTFFEDLGIPADTLGRAHYNDRWYYATGQLGRVSDSPGEMRPWGMQRPTERPVLIDKGLDETLVARVEPVGVTPDPTHPGYGVSVKRPEEMADGDLNTYGTMRGVPGNRSYGSGTPPLLPEPQVLRFTGFPSDTAGDRFLYINWESVTFGEAKDTTKIQVWVDEGSGLNLVWERNTFDNGDVVGEWEITKISVDPSLVTVEIHLFSTWAFDDNGFTGNDCTLAIRDLKITSAGALDSFYTSQTGIGYAITEWDSVKKIESPVIGYGSNPESSVLRVSHPDGSPTKINYIVLGLPDASLAANAGTTHWRIYRTPDIGKDTVAGDPTEDTVFPAPDSLGRVGEVELGTTEWTDIFTYPPYETGPEPYPMLSVTSPNGGTVRTDFNVAPPAMTDLATFKSVLVGIRGRSLFYSAEGFPESWPVAYTIDTWPLEENDNLVALRSLGGTLIVGAKGSMLRVQSLPLATGGVFTPGVGEEIAGTPGCVGRKAMTVFGTTGESLCAWIADNGVHITNGFTFDLISEDMNWAVLEDLDKQPWTLEWDEARRVLIMSYSTIQTPDGLGGVTHSGWRYAFFHMDQTHRKPNQRPKVTSGHYGNLYSLDAAPFEGRRLLVSGDHAGVAYYEDVTDEDESNAYDANGNVYSKLTLRRLRSAGVRATVIKLQPLISATEAMKVSVTSGRDGKNLREKIKSILPGAASRFKQMYFGMNGDWHEVSAEHIGKTPASVSRVQMLLSMTKGQGPT